MKLLFRVMMVCVVVLQLLLSGCGGGGDGKSVPGLVKGVGWVYDNFPADYSDYAMGLRVWVYYDPFFVGSAIDGVTVTPPDGKGRWSVQASNNNTGTNSGGTYITARLINAKAPERLPLAGTWTFTIKFKDGTTSSYQRTFHQPGSLADATHPYVYAKDDWTPYSNTSQYVAALGRFSAFGYTLQYSSAGGGSITSTGLANVRSTFLNAEPLAYNMNCWLYDANKVYLGYTDMEFTRTDHSSTGLVTPGGELALTTPAITWESGVTDLSQVKYIRVVYYDGAQFAPGYGYDFRSVSYLVPVN